MNKASDSFTGLSPHLIGTIFPMKRVGDNTLWARDDSQQPFEAPLTQATMDTVINWISPFEGAGVEAKAGALAQMAQSGSFKGILQAVGGHIPEGFVQTKEFVDDLTKASEGLVGKSGVTKLNAMQIYGGSPPLKIQITAFLRAFKDPFKEVEAPLKQLHEWTLPRYLAPDSPAAEFIKSGFDVLALMPSDTPTIVGFIYKSRIFQPCVIESVSDPLDSPIDRHGNRISASVQITLTSLTALDRHDWKKTYRTPL